MMQKALRGLLTLVVVALAVATSEDSLPTPCREWLFPCQGGSWRCISEETYQRYQSGRFRLGCPVIEVETPPTPPPGQCRPVNGTCQYTEPVVECCGVNTRGFSSCDSDSHLAAQNKSCPPLHESTPSPDNLCLPINDSCHWFNPCRAWRGYCLSPYRCGTLSEYYAFLNGPVPGCVAPPEGWVEPVPPGECIVNANQECGWSNCTAFMNWCQTDWICGTQYDHDLYMASPPPPCPPPPPNHTPPPPPLPGHCRFDVQENQCRFQPENPRVCPQGMEPTNCASLCPTTCSNHDNPPACIEVCVEGCACPEGTILDDLTGAGCIPPTECVIVDDACTLGAVQCPPHHFCVPDSTAPEGAVCLRRCNEADNGGCDDDQLCVTEPYCEDCEMSDVMAGVCRDIPGPDADRRLVTAEIIGLSAGIVVAAIALVVVIEIVVCCRRRLHRQVGVDTVTKMPVSELPRKDLDCKYSELSMDSVSESSFEKEDLSIQCTSKNDVIMT